MQSLWEHPDFDAHEGVHVFTDRDTGLKAIIAVHSTHLGPGGGGVRFWHYADPADAMTDALRLSRGMSYKNAMAGLAMGGGKGVILADAARTKTADLFRAFGRAIESQNGAYVTAEDVGMTEADMVTIGEATRHVSGLPVAAGQAGGDPGPYTSRGVFLGVRAAAKRALGKDSLAGLHIAIQGVGSVGGGLVRHAAKDGARLTVADVDMARARRLADEVGGVAVPAEAIMTLEADIFSPNALGAILTETSIAGLKVAAVAGGANNQLARPGDGDRLHARGILYAPDYVINAGGIINVATEYLKDGGPETVAAKIDGIPERLHRIWDESAASGRNPAAVADAMAQALIGRG